MKNRIIATLCFLIFAFGVNAQSQFNAMVFTKTKGWHHKAIHEGIKGLRSLADKHNFRLNWQESADVFSDNSLKRYDVVIFLHTTSDILNEEQQAAFERYIQAGGGYVGVHAAADTEYGWEWYTKLVGRMFRTHPKEQTAYLNILDTDFPGMERFASPRQIWTDEWYQFREPALVDDLHYLLSVDESTYDPRRRLRDGSMSEGMGDFHPISWYHEYDGGRSFYTALGHMPALYIDQTYLHHLYGGIYWAATGKGLK